MKMSEVVGIGNSSVGGDREVHVEASVSNDLGSVEVEDGFETMGAISGPPVTRLQHADLAAFMERLTPIGSVALATTDVAFTASAAMDPWSLFIQNTVIARKIADYLYIRGTLEVEVVVNVPAGTFGRYYVAAVPNGSSNFAFTGGTIGLPFEAVECVPHVAIDVASSTRGKLVLPWINWNDYADIRDLTTPSGLEGMYEMRVYCYHPITQGNGATTPDGTISFYARCQSDVELIIPYQQGKKEPSLVTRGRDQINRTVQRATGGLKASQISGAIATASGALSGIPLIGALATPLAAGAAAVTSVLDWFGFTRSTGQKPPLPVVQRPFSNVATADGVDTSELCALSVGNSISVDPRIGGGDGSDAASFAYLTQHYVLVAYTAWTTSDAKGAVLDYYPVSPYFTLADTNAGAVFPLAGYLGLPFSYWRADMEYKVVIPVSKFHRGALQLSWTRQNVSAADPTNNQYNHIFDVTAGKEWEFTVGYADPTPMLEAWPHAFSDSIYSSAGCNGTLRIGVVNPLEAPSATAGTTIFLYARAKPGFQVGAPRTTWPGTTDLEAHPIDDFASSVYLQGGALGDDVVEVDRVVLVPPAASFPLKEVCMGENVESARMLVQKFSHDVGASRVFGSAGYNTVILNHIPMYPSTSQHLNYSPAAPASAPDPICFNWFSWYAALFVGVASSTRYKIINAGADPMPFALYAANTNLGINVSAATFAGSFGAVSAVWPPRQAEGLEVTVPYYHNHKYLPTYGITSAAGVLTGAAPGRVDVLNAPPIVSGTATPTPAIALYIAAGPDVRFHTFRCPKRVYYSALGDPNPRYANAAFA